MSFFDISKALQKPLNLTREILMGHVVTLPEPVQKKAKAGVRQSDMAFDAIHKAIVRCELMPGSIVNVCASPMPP